MTNWILCSTTPAVSRQQVYLHRRNSSRGRLVLLLCLLVLPLGRAGARPVELVWSPVKATTPTEILSSDRPVFSPPPPDTVFYNIFRDSLAVGLDMGVNTSGGRTD